jgi:hypothetical protein
MEVGMTVTLTAWWVTCLDCRRAGRCIEQLFDTETARTEWLTEHRNETGHKSTSLWSRTSGVSA